MVESGVVGVGYEGRDADSVVRGLVADGVGLLVDVRMTPISRKPGLSKTALRERLRDNGIEYLHLRELGNPKDNRAGFAGDAAQRAVAFARYREVLDSPEARVALRTIREHARTQRVALLCFEADRHRCHRELIIEALARDDNVPAH